MLLYRFVENGLLKNLSSDSLSDAFYCVNCDWSFINVSLREICLSEPDSCLFVEHIVVSSANYWVVMKKAD